ncbi:thiamine diphosphokinase [Prolixibacteraceae bacterium Z1-6]|uniref:Thiamine diphosphokinase n=1 Tax=Draconibacterium aestuarii TaxID=2998507 RepID=A0A9X3FD88_9BACT|nr:thiamine diphosphokinase [Prolixibacteraceae bacterium Z1-6]
MNQIKFKSNVVILCDGAFPEHPIPLSYLKNAEQIICCDAAADKLIEHGMTPAYIVGDMDSVSEKTKSDFADRIVSSTDQETNDQTKAVDFVSKRGFKSVVILGATGKREDHTIGNISLLLDYASKLDVVSISNSGYFQPVLKSQKFDSFKGQQVSIFSIGNPTPVTSQNLKYPLNNTTLNSWWMGTLNECLSNTFSLEFSNGRFIVFQKFDV